MSVQTSAEHTATRRLGVERTRFPLHACWATFQRRVSTLRVVLPNVPNARVEVLVGNKRRIPQQRSEPKILELPAGAGFVHPVRHRRRRRRRVSACDQIAAASSSGQ